jgi:hypothetical protein
MMSILKKEENESNEDKSFVKEKREEPWKK